MRKIVVSEWISLDGVFAADTMKQWFDPYDSEARQECIKELVLASGAFLLGRVSYEMLAGYWPNVKDDDPQIEVATRLNSAPKYVVSTTLKKAAWNNSTIVSKNVAEEVTTLKRSAGQNILVFGSATLVQSLIEADLIDEYRILVHPIVMGSGARAFKEGRVTAKLRLIDTKTLSSGVISLHYEATRN